MANVICFRKLTQFLWKIQETEKGIATADNGQKENRHNRVKFPRIKDLLKTSALVFVVIV